nr:D-glycero-beta-D-manno-heptose 1-phosphate adenylyltransferase [Desulfobacterales bacterium]
MEKTHVRISDKIKDPSSLRLELQGLKKDNKKIVFTNGCFDILHLGHVRYLEAAKAEGDILVVGVNSDHSVRCIKGPGRPILPQDQRTHVLAALASVDFVTIFDEPDPLNLIESLRPDVLVKGADWDENEIVGRDIVEADGGRVVRIPLVKGVSTTGIVKRILNVYKIT